MNNVIQCFRNRKINWEPRTCLYKSDVYHLKIFMVASKKKKMLLFRETVSYLHSMKKMRKTRLKYWMKTDTFYFLSLILSTASIDPIVVSDLFCISVSLFNIKISSIRYFSFNSHILIKDTLSYLALL